MGLSALLCVGIAAWLWRYRSRNPATRSFVHLMLGVGIWALSGALEAGLSDVGAKLMAAKLSYLGITTVPVFWFLFALRYADLGRRLGRRLPILLMIFPLVSIAIVFTTEWHGWVWSSISPDYATGTMIYGHGWWWWAMAVYSYALMFGGTAVLVAAAVGQSGIYRKQAVAVVLGGTIPWLGNLVYLAGRSPWPGVDPAAVLFTAGGLVIAWALVRYNLLDITPVVRSVLIDTMSDVCLAVDSQGRLLYANDVAERLFQLAPQSLGRAACEVFAPWPSLVELLQDQTVGDGPALLTIRPAGQATDELVFAATRTPVPGGAGGLQARTFVLHDVTLQVRAQAKLEKTAEALRRDIEERRRLEGENLVLLQAAQKRAEEAETLRHAAAAVAAPLQLEPTVNRILEELRRVVPYDASVVWVVEGRSLVSLGARGDALGTEKVESGIPTFSVGARGLACIELADVAEPMREVLEQRRPIWLESESGAQTAVPLFATGGYPSWLGVPLVVKDRVMGLMELWSAEARAFGADESRLVAAFADQVAVALENARLFEETRRLAITDPLTGLYNRRQFFVLGERGMELALRYPSRRLSAFLLDIDHFKQVNDSYGHATGDRVLVEVARVLRQELRKIDLFARVGGEEFAGLLPESGLDGARQTAERLRVRFESLSSPSIPRFTVSLGVAEVGPDCPDLDTLLEQCDQALYEAKGRGRNQVAVFGAGRAVRRGW